MPKTPKRKATNKISAIRLFDSDSDSDLTYTNNPTNLSKPTGLFVPFTYPPTPKTPINKPKYFPYRRPDNVTDNEEEFCEFNIDPNGSFLTVKSQC